MKMMRPKMVWWTRKELEVSLCRQNMAKKEGAVQQCWQGPL